MTIAALPIESNFLESSNNVSEHSLFSLPASEYVLCISDRINFTILFTVSVVPSPYKHHPKKGCRKT